MQLLTALLFTAFFNLNSQSTAVENSPYINSTIEHTYVSFTLRNESAKSIPLIIPGVMNPNLSPMSNSGVSLKVGQKVLYKYKGKKRVLLKVTKDLEGKTLKVHKLLNEAKKVIDEN